MTLKPEIQYSKDFLYKLSLYLEPKACKVFLLLWSKADAEGYIKEVIAGKDTSLNTLHEATGTAKTTISKSVEELQRAGVLRVSHEVGTKTHYWITKSEELNEEFVAEALSNIKKKVKK